MTLHTQTPFDPLTGLPVIRVIHAVNRVLGTTGRNVHADDVEASLLFAVPVVEIAGLEFFRWGDLIDFLAKAMPVDLEDEAP